VDWNYEKIVMPVKEINAKQFKELLKNRENLELIDVRQPEEYAIARIKGSKLIPMRELRTRLGEIDWNKEVIFLCRSGNRSKLMAQLVSGDKVIKNLQYGIYECYLDKDCPDLEILSDEVETYF